MMRYTVIVIDSSSQERLSLLIPYPPTATCAALTEETVRRASKQGKNLDNHDFTLRLGDVDGPILDHDDILSEVIVDEKLFATYRVRSDDVPAASNNASQTVGVRIITPQTAKEGRDSDTVSPPAFHLPQSATIQQLYNLVVQHLNKSLPDPSQSAFTFDLHTHEFPISSTSYKSTLHDSGLDSLVTDGILTVYAVMRHGITLNDAEPVVRVGRNDLYSAGDHWEPEIRQSARAMAIFLSFLRVFAHLMRSSKVSDDQKDRTLYVFDLLTRFPPAIPALYLLMQGKVFTHSSSAALSQAFFHVLQDIVPNELIKDDKSKVFMPARLLLGLMIEKSKHLVPLISATSSKYNPRFEVASLQDEARRLISTDTPMTENPNLISSPRPANQLDLITLSDNKIEVTLFLQPEATFTAQRLESVISGQELRELPHLATLCGRASLSVYKPSNLESVVPECLTFDKNGHVAVYTGQKGCSMPGEGIIIFRPAHGEDTPNIGLLEQQLDPILRRHQADKSDIYDSLGSPEARILEAPEEIVMFCVDCSASMGGSSDFADIDPGNDFDFESETTDPALPAKAFAKAKFEEIDRRLSEHEVFNDILATVAEADTHWKILVAEKMLSFLSDLLAESLEVERQKPARFREHQAFAVEERIEIFCAGLQKFKVQLVDLLVFRAINLPKQKSWLWHIGDPVPNRGRVLPRVPLDFVQVPISLKCPASSELLKDPVNTADGQTFSREAMSMWLQIKKVSPLTGLPIANTHLRPNLDLAERLENWVQAEDLLNLQDPQEGQSRKKRRKSGWSVTFQGTSGLPSFTRDLPSSLSILDLYKVAFRGMRGRYTTFQLSTTRDLVPGPDKIASHGIKEGSIIKIITSDSDGVMDPYSQPVSLVKIYRSERLYLSYWVCANNSGSFASVVAKYWRFHLLQDPLTLFEKATMMTDLDDRGDGCLFGSPRKLSDSLYPYLQPAHTFGILGHEPVQRVEPIHSDDQMDLYSDYDSEDSGNSEDSEEPGNPPVLVLKLHVHHTGRSNLEKSKKLSRLDVLKQMFEALINRIIAYSYKTHVGLVTFSTRPLVAQSITHIIENFRSSVENMRAHGDTALWDGLKLAKEQIKRYAVKYPNVPRRIICLSDGNDTKSFIGAADVYRQLRQENILVDSICIGQEDHLDLKTVSSLLKSYCFYPKGLRNALAVCELEPMLSLTERPVVDFGPTGPDHQSFANTNAVFRNARYSSAFTTVTRDVFPQRKEHVRLRDSVIRLADCERKKAGGFNVSSNLRSSRLLREMRIVAMEPHPMFDCYVSEADMSFWQVVMEGPLETPYADCTFLLYLDMGEDFPSFAPKGRFVTPILHPNINRHGRICHSIFDRNWTTDTGLDTVLSTVYGLLFNAETSDAVHTTVTLDYQHDEVAFAEEARQHAKKHGKKTREQWKKELLGED